jgi:hypothetical protein
VFLQLLFMRDFTLASQLFATWSARPATSEETVLASRPDGCSTT